MQKLLYVLCYIGIYIYLFGNELEILTVKILLLDLIGNMTGN